MTVPFISISSGTKAFAQITHGLDKGTKALRTSVLAVVDAATPAEASRVLKSANMRVANGLREAMEGVNSLNTVPAGAPLGRNTIHESTRIAWRDQLDFLRHGAFSDAGTATAFGSNPADDARMLLNLGKRHTALATLRQQIQAAS